MNLPNYKIVKKLKEQYPIGTRVELLEMDDCQAPPIYTLGTVIGVDDIGSIMVHWDNGSSLNIVYGIDKCRKVAIMNKKVREQILYIRDTGATNMFDTRMVQYLANEYGFYELAVYLEEHKKEYVNFIMTGKES